MENYHFFLSFEILEDTLCDKWIIIIIRLWFREVLNKNCCKDREYEYCLWGFGDQGLTFRSKDELKLILRNECTRFTRSRYPITKDAYRIIRCKNLPLPIVVQSYYKLKPRLDAGIAWGIIGNRESLENVKTIPRPTRVSYQIIRDYVYTSANLTCFAVSRFGISCISAWFNHVPI